MSTEALSCLFVVIVHLNDVWFVCVSAVAPCAGEAEREREVSEDKVTYPLDEEGDNLNSYGEKTENIFGAPRVRWTLEFFFFRGEKSWEKVSVEREDQK